MRLLRTTGTLLSAATAALAASGCSFITGVRNVSRVTVTVAPDVIGINQTSQAYGTAFDGNTALTNNSNNSNRYNVTYTSRNSNVVTVDPARGFIVGKSYGTTYIIGENNGKRDSAKITVRPVQAQQLIIGNKTPVYRVGAQNFINATALDSVGQRIGDRAATWVSRNTAVLTITNLGVVSPLTVGSSWIVASIDNGPGAKPAVDSVLATVTPVPVASVSITPNNASNNTPTIYTGQTLQFTATLTDSLSNAVTRAVTWSTSDNGRVLAINPQTGLATGIAPTFGTTNVFATIDVVPGVQPPRTISTSVAVAVLAPVDSTRVFNASFAEITTLSVAAGSTTGVNFVAIDVLKNTLTGRTFSLTSSNPAVATVPATTSGASQVTAVGAGTATITAQALDANGQPQGKKSTITVTVQ